VIRLFYNIYNTVKIVSVIKFVAINLAVFAILLVGLNWACGVYLRKTSKSNRSELPNYSDNHEHARAVFADYNRIQHRYEPFVGWKTLPYTGKTTHISQSGLRTHDPEATDAAVKPVVRFFGGSTMWGEGSDDDNTIPALFNDLNPRFKVYNHGQLAYNTRQEVDELISVYSREERTDVVIFYDGVNDAAFLCPKVITELPAHRLVPMYRDKLYVGRSAMIKEVMKKIFIEDILAVIQKHTYKPTPDNSPYDCTSDKEKAEGIAEMMMKNWELAHEIVTARNGTFIAVLQPAAYIGNPRTDHLQLDEELGKNFDEIYTRLSKKIAERRHPWIIDLSRAFDNQEYIFIDFCHVSPNGNAIIAREISNVVNGLEE
jgi:hypothetical protein